MSTGTESNILAEASTFYRVEQDDYCVCNTCHQDAPNWTIVSGTGDDECGIGQSWGDKETADDICDLMNMAFDAGKETTAEPDLLAALKDMCDWVAGGLQASDSAMPDPECLAETERLAARCRAAVNKAEGRS